jgi:RNA polymerase sigma factor (sigma-70 family)
MRHTADRLQYLYFFQAATTSRLPASNRFMSDDQRLLSDLRAGKRGAVERLIQRHQALVLHMVGRLVDNPEDVRELCQEVFLRVHSRLHQFRGESSLSTWIGSIAFSIGAAHLRKKRIAIVEVDEEAQDELLSSQPDPVDMVQAFADQDISKHLHRAINELAPLQRTLITLYYLDECSVEAIAAMTALPAGTVKNYLFRARLKLRQTLAGKLENPLEATYGQ